MAKVTRPLDMGHHYRGSANRMSAAMDYAAYQDAVAAQYSRASSDRSRRAISGALWPGSSAWTPTVIPSPTSR